MSAALDLARGFLDRLDDPGSGDLLGAVRRAGRERFAESGFPTRRGEAWRYTDLTPLTEARFAAGPVDATGLDEAALAQDGADRLVFVDGRLDRARSRVGALQQGALVAGFADWAASNPAEAAAAFDVSGGADNAFRALNAAWFADGAVVIVPEGTSLPRPVHLVYWNTGAAAHVKSLLRLGPSASAVVTETYAGAGAGWTNASVTADLAEGARLARHVLQTEATGAFHTAHLAVSIGRGAALDGFLLTLGARLGRQDAEIVLAGDHARCGFSGAYLLDGGQQAAMRSLIRHAAPHGRTHEVFKGCLADHAHGAFQGKILVEPAAQKTDGYQLNKTMLLGDRAVMDAKPELEIYADDVKCSHGATVGDLDETALFYLRSRGIEPVRARHMLIEAFVQDAVDLIDDPGIRAWFGREVTRRLEGFQS